jgi:hypothetical protein
MITLITPTVELINKPTCETVGDINPFLIAARTCYASKSKGPESDKNMFNKLWEHGHRSMYRHITRYFHIPCTGLRCEENRHNIMVFYEHYKHCPYISFQLGVDSYIAVNEQFYREDEELDKLLKETFNDVHELPLASIYTLAPNLCRFTFKIVTNILVARELNRVSPNAIAEQSTRYVNFGKNNNITMIIPEWYSNKTTEEQEQVVRDLTLASEMYLERVRSGWPIEEARYFLPLDTASVLVYTYSIPEWKNIINLRYKELTGKAAPEAKRVISQVYFELCKLGYGKYLDSNE